MATTLVDRATVVFEKQKELQGQELGTHVIPKGQLMVNIWY
jgi:hypothetical protein